MINILYLTRIFFKLLLFRIQSCDSISHLSDFPSEIIANNFYLFFKLSIPLFSSFSEDDVETCFRRKTESLSEQVFPPSHNIGQPACTHCSSFLDALSWSISPMTSFLSLPVFWTCSCLFHLANTSALNPSCF